ncbi:hypothetical protein G3I60_04370 [Streptomyces sp. SID13666]|uniref:hypothetical protein n=1 Tax=unclassified Streptomyces TaxID=2593676 RepID=UPI0013C06347|nr:MULTISPECIES: hypothetical protein [unclassified Streptomyces]NEA53416.1 hypothetical protein [Streptomyces sp. SID13666]NEA69259.1 hypothetical protein [Streptomyces sp. SID13588]
MSPKIRHPKAEVLKRRGATQVLGIWANRTDPDGKTYVFGYDVDGRQPTVTTQAAGRARGGDGCSGCT